MGVGSGDFFQLGEKEASLRGGMCCARRKSWPRKEQRFQAIGMLSAKAQGEGRAGLFNNSEKLRQSERVSRKLGRWLVK